MASIEGAIADAVVAAFDNNKAAILAGLQAENVNIADAVENFALAVVAKNPFLNAALGGVIKGLGPEIVAALGGEEPAAIALVDAWLHQEAVKLGG